MATNQRIEKKGDRFGVIGDLSLHGVVREVELQSVKKTNAAPLAA